MSDYRPTNDKIAELLQQQTYAERMDMARWFAEVVSDRGNEPLSSDDFATYFESWADLTTDLSDEINAPDDGSRS